MVRQERTRIDRGSQTRFEWKKRESRSSRASRPMDMPLRVNEASDLAVLSDQMHHVEDEKAQLLQDLAVGEQPR